MNKSLPSTLRFLRVVWPRGDQDDERDPDARHLWRGGAKEWGVLDGKQSELQVRDVWRRRDRVRRAINAASPAGATVSLYTGTEKNLELVDVWSVPGVLSRDAQPVVEPVAIRDARAFVDTHHSHHKAPIGAKFALGVTQYGRLQCVALVGRPVSRMLARDGATWEITREACDSATPGMASKLIRASADEAIARGARHVVSYTLLGETGASYRGARFHPSGVTRGGEWSRPSRGRAPAQQSRPKVRWSYGPDAPARDMEAERLLREHAGDVIPSRFDTDDDDAEMETRENPTRTAAGPYTVALRRAAQAVDAEWARVTSSRTQRGAIEELKLWAGPSLTLGDLVRVDDADGRTVALYLCDGYALRTAPRFPATLVDQEFTVTFDDTLPTDRSAARWIETWEGPAAHAHTMVRVCWGVHPARLALAAIDCARWTLSLGVMAKFVPSNHHALDVARAVALGDAQPRELAEARAAIVEHRTAVDPEWNLHTASMWSVWSALDAAMAAVGEPTRAGYTAHQHAMRAVSSAADTHHIMRHKGGPRFGHATREDFESLAPIFRRHVPLPIMLCALAKLPDPLALEQTRANPARATQRRNARGALPSPSTHRHPHGPRRLVGMRPTRA